MPKYIKQDFPEYDVAVYTLREAYEDECENSASNPKCPYFDSPAQCKFLDIFERVPYYKGGIAYRDEVISGETGVTYKICEIYRSAPSSVPPIIVYNDWQNISYEIRQM